MSGSQGTLYKLFYHRYYIKIIFSVFKKSFYFNNFFYVRVTVNITVAIQKQHKIMNILTSPNPQEIHVKKKKKKGESFITLYVPMHTSSPQTFFTSKKKNRR